MFKELKSAFLVFVVLTVLTGVLYPLLITAFAQIFFNKQANGSLIYVDGKAAGSEFIGQSMDDPKYFWSRPSLTTPAYNASASSGSNYGPLNPALKDAVSSRVKALKDADPSNNKPVPVDLVTASGSGLDPHISPAAAYYQASRIAHERDIAEDTVKKIIAYHLEHRFAGVVGEPVINVLKINLFLDEFDKNPKISLKKPSPNHLPERMKW